MSFSRTSDRNTPALLLSKLESALSRLLGRASPWKREVNENRRPNRSKA